MSHFALFWMRTWVSPLLILWVTCYLGTSLSAQALTLKEAAPLLGYSTSRLAEHAIGHTGRRHDPPARYIKMSKVGPILRIGVVNHSSHVSPSFLKRVLKAVKKQVERDFAPYYGISVTFRLFSDSSAADWSQYVPLVIPDLLLIDQPLIAFHSYQFPLSLNGMPIEKWIAHPPSLPAGIPYILIPIGNEATSYGVRHAAHAGGSYLPSRFKQIFSWALSHEVLETLANYSISHYFLADRSSSLEFYMAEVCDAVEYTPGYQIDGIQVSDFVLPNWFIPNWSKPFNFLNTMSHALTPFRGETPLIRVDGNGEVGICYLISPPDQPEACYFTPLELLFSPSIENPSTLPIKRCRTEAMLRATYCK